MYNKISIVKQTFTANTLFLFLYFFFFCFRSQVTNEVLMTNEIISRHYNPNNNILLTNLMPLSSFPLALCHTHIINFHSSFDLPHPKLMIERQYSKLCEMHAQRQCPKRSRSSTERGKNLDAVRDLLTLSGPR